MSSKMHNILAIHPMHDIYGGPSEPSTLLAPMRIVTFQKKKESTSVRESWSFQFTIILTIDCFVIMVHFLATTSMARIG